MRAFKKIITTQKLIIFCPVQILFIPELENIANISKFKLNRLTGNDFFLCKFFTIESRECHEHLNFQIE
jgi:hypothetical protein